MAVVQLEGRVAAVSTKELKGGKYTKWGYLIQPVDGSEAQWCNTLDELDIVKDQYVSVMCSKGPYGLEALDADVIAAPGDPIEGVVTAIAKKNITTVRGPAVVTSIKLDGPGYTDPLWVQIGFGDLDDEVKKGVTVRMNVFDTQYGKKLVIGTLSVVAKK